MATMFIRTSSWGGGGERVNYIKDKQHSIPQFPNRMRHLVQQLPFSVCGTDS